MWGRGDDPGEGDEESLACFHTPARQRGIHLPYPLKDIVCISYKISLSSLGFFPSLHLFAITTPFTATYKVIYLERSYGAALKGFAVCGQKGVGGG